MTVYDLYKYVNYLSRKDPTGNTFSPEEFNIVLPIVAYKFFKKYYGIPESYLPGQPLPAIAHSITQAAADKNVDLIKNATLSFSGGVASFPNDYYHYISIEDQVEVLNAQEYDMRHSISILIPTEARPVCTFSSQGITISPDTITSKRMTYLRKPTEPVMGYTVDANYDVVYDNSTSTQFDWEDDLDAMDDIAQMLLNMVGISLREPILSQYSDKEVNT